MKPTRANQQQEEPHGTAGPAVTGVKTFQRSVRGEPDLTYCCDSDLVGPILDVIFWWFETPKQAKKEGIFAFLF